MSPIALDAPRRAPGFTLLEVVIALAIAMLALIGLFQAGGVGLSAADTAARIDEAVERAQSHLAAFAQSGVIAAGTVAGDDGDGFLWELRAARVAQTTVAASPPAAGVQGAPAASAIGVALYSLQATVSWRAGLRTRSVVLETRRLAPAPSGEPGGQ